MKKRFLLFVLALIASTVSFAQSWSSNSGNLYLNPTTAKVGIGTMTPAYQLHVYSPTIPEFCIGNPKGGLRTIIANNAGEGAPTSRAGDACFIMHGVDDDNVGVIFNFNNNDNNGNRYVKFCDYANNDIMAIYNNATVKIDGKLFAKEIEVKTNVWADFVFKPDYNLMPLNELEHFIKQNNHLPDVPTEAEVKENGINVAEMNARLLQKIEELTLYVIEQQKQIDELKSK